MAKASPIWLLYRARGSIRMETEGTNRVGNVTKQDMSYQSIADAKSGLTNATVQMGTHLKIDSKLFFM